MIQLPQDKTDAFCDPPPLQCTNVCSETAGWSAEATDDMLGSRNIDSQALILGRLVDLENHLKDLDEQC